MTDPTANEAAPNRITLEFGQSDFAVLCDAADGAGLPLDEWVIAVLMSESHFTNLPPLEFIDEALDRVIDLSSRITAARAYLEDNTPEPDQRN